MHILRFSAFGEVPGGGNPAGVVLDAAGLNDETMLRIARDIGYSETAFVVAGPGECRTAALRYFSPHAEVPFCGHATVAAVVALAERHGPGVFEFETPVGPITLRADNSSGKLLATFTSVEPSVQELDPTAISELLAQLSLSEGDLDTDYPPREAFAGNPHPILVVHEKAAFDGLEFNPAKMRALMDERGWTGTVTVMWSKHDTEFEARNIFPVGAIIEDPATGSAAASFGAYLRETTTLALPADVVIRQGRHVMRPSVLHVGIPVSGGITVTGSALEISD